jgi:hypothetical protein
VPDSASELSLDRFRGSGRFATMITNPVKAIRANCIECSGGSVSEVAQCVMPDCPLYPFRFGRNPYRKKRTLSEAQKAAARKNLRLSAGRERATGDSGAHSSVLGEEGPLRGRNAAAAGSPLELTSCV